MEPNHKAWNLPFGFSFHIHHLGNYMRRWWLRFPNGATLRLHNILRDDNDAHLHDHPFSFTSLILKGSYSEIYPTGYWVDFVRIIDDASQNKQRYFKECRLRRYPRGSVIKHEASDLHLLTGIDKPVWTLVWASPKERDWGFQVEDKWVHHLDYFNTTARLTA